MDLTKRQIFQKWAKIWSNNVTSKLFQCNATMFCSTFWKTTASISYIRCGFFVHFTPFFIQVNAILLLRLSEMHFLEMLFQFPHTILRVLLANNLRFTGFPLDKFKLWNTLHILKNHAHYMSLRHYIILCLLVKYNNFF